MGTRSRRELSAGLAAILLMVLPVATLQKNYTLTTATTDGVPSITLDASGAKLTEIVTDLATRLKLRMLVGPSLATELTFARFINSPLEQALAALGTRVVIDYEFRRDAPPAPQAVYLLGASDPDPATDATVRGSSFGVAIEGNTEDTTTPSPNDPLKVMLDGDRLTVVSRKQPLSLVVRAVADALGVTADLKYDASEPLDIDLRDMRPEDAVPRFSQNVRYYVRVTLGSAKSRPLRIVVEQSSGKKIP